MKYNSDIHNRRSIRLKDYDYSQAGAYFVTICTQNRECVFCKIVDGQMRLNEYGRIVENTWLNLTKHNDNIALDAFVIMPNHFHGIINIVGAGSKPALAFNDNNDMAITERNRAGLEPAPTTTQLPEIVRQFKTFSSRQINQIRNSQGVPLWQRNYYEHIIRNEPELHKIREYIVNNPFSWETDENYKA